MRDAYEVLTEKGIAVIGVSFDNQEEQTKFKTNNKLPFTLLADEKGEVVKAFGVPKIAGKFASRQAFLFKDGKLVWRDLKASTAQQAQDVLAALKSLEESGKDGGKATPGDAPSKAEAKGGAEDKP